MSVRWARRVATVAMGVGIFGCSGANDGSADPESEGEAQRATPDAGAYPSSQRALDAFFDAFLDADLDSLPAVQRGLADASRRDPREPLLARALGMSFMWQSAENARAKRPLSATELEGAGGAALGELHRLTTIGADDPRNFTFLGTAMVSIGGATSDLSMAQSGIALVEEHAMPTEKADGSFALGAALVQAPLGTRGFGAGVEHFFAGFEECLGTKLDRAAPDFAGWSARRTSARPHDVCFDQPHWPHAEEGNFLVFGDALVKAGNVEAARRAYAAAESVPSYGAWRFKGVLEDRLGADLAVRAAAYRTAGTTPPAIGAAPSNCGQCHAK